MIMWQPPPESWVCLNTDASINPSTGFNSVGGAIRSHAGTWLIGFHKSIGITTPLQAELWGIFIGLQVAWEQGYERLQVQSDNSQAIQLLNDNAGQNSFPLVRNIL
ncbi:hypothetical protein F3Y22_tig00110819pilonHSYRG00319 [Hibiscus syriacus]|uniref:RNase H type-1 domain-containing protein n=1 Tax=Hibiscus syriacus TaxID=106335 RepID=A0A6A2ZMV3_HIBSY|nr:hypothetical protein F3Y22_tig00110819pilonHSYRG00319 [Hibiscus syriacus]